MRIIWKSWNSGNPFVGLVFDSDCDLSEFREKLKNEFGRAVGNLYHDNQLRLSGRAAILSFTLLGQEIPLEFKSWIPKFDPFRLFKLTDEEIVADARRFSERNQWRKENRTYPHVHHHRRHLISACTAHMISPGGPFQKGYQVYAYEFSDHSVYVGLTCNPTRRHNDHLKKGPVAVKIRSGADRVLKVIKDGLMPTAASQCEDDTIESYRAIAWALLNRKKGGSTGQIRTKYTYVKLLEIARPAKTRKQFQLLDNGAYQYSCNHDLVDRLAADLDWPIHVGHKWTREKCLQEAEKFTRLSDWALLSPASYQAAWKHGWHTDVKRSLFARS